MEEPLKRDDTAGYKYAKSFEPTGDGFTLAVVNRNGKKRLERFGYRGWSSMTPSMSPDTLFG
ncbi:hypothetical protein Aduo_012044 [Ancylostoma duodenale]